MAAPYYYGPGYGSYAYEPGPGYYAPSVAWCEQHYRSYDPASQTYLGYDGYRHHCP
ncbi:MAG: BA14K family protein [Pseudolabrys sp.]